jgi:hypothetical protein
MQVQPGPVCVGKSRAGADTVVAAALEVVQADPYTDAAAGVVGALQQTGILLKRGRKRLGIGGIRHDHRPNSNLTRSGEGRLRADAHIDDGRRPRQQRFSVGRERADICMLVGELRLLALDHRQPLFERQAFGAAARQAGMRMGMRVDESGEQRRTPALDDG